MTTIIPNSAAMEQVGGQLARVCEPRSVLHLIGELGTGKTTLVRGFLIALGHRGAVRSPTYTLLELYPFDGFTVYHLDLYRIVDPEELEYLGLRDFLTEKMVCLIEWPYQGGHLTPPADLELHLDYHPRGRCLTLRPQNEWGQVLINRFTL